MRCAFVVIVVCLYLQETFRKGKMMETEITLGVAWGWGREQELVQKGGGNFLRKRKCSQIGLR